MPFLAKSATVVAPARVQASHGSGDPFAGLYNGYYPPEWGAMLSASGVAVSPELAMTLSSVYCAVTTILDDISTLPAQLFQYTGADGAKERVRGARPGLGRLSYVLRWAPNSWQTAKEFWGMEVGHLMLRGNAYARIVSGVSSGLVEQLIPLHPDLTRPERLPSGRIRYKRLDARRQDEPDAYSQEEIFHLRDLTTDGLVGRSRIGYGVQSFGTMLAKERFAGKFFKSGMTAALLASYKGGEMDPEEEASLHASISRFAAGTENSFGLMLAPEELKIEKLGIEPEKAQLLQSREFSVREVARWFKMPGHKLEASQQTQAYAAREQANLEYVIGCLRPIVVGIEQAIQRDLLIPELQETYFVEFLMDALLRGDLKARADYYGKAIRNRWMRPSEVRIRENMNPDERLDQLSEQDFRPGRSGGRGDRSGEPSERDAQRLARAERRLLQFTRAGAERVVHKELEAVAKAAKKHANDVPGWQAWLQDFYEDHARFAAQVLCLPVEATREYAAQHGLILQEKGATVLDDWRATEVDALTALALEAKESKGLAAA